MKKTKNNYGIDIFIKEDYKITNYVANKRIKLILNNLHREMKILDIGCGNKYITNKIKSEGYDIIGIDKNSLSKWSNKEPDIVMDATKMNFRDNTFDIVLAIEVLEHCNCISEIKRVLKPNGLLICSTPTPKTQWIRNILIKLGLLQNQDSENHRLFDLRRLPMKNIEYRKMFLRTSQYGVFKK